MLLSANVWNHIIKDRFQAFAAFLRLADLKMKSHHKFMIAFILQEYQYCFILIFYYNILITFCIVLNIKLLTSYLKKKNTNPPSRESVLPLLFAAAAGNSGINNERGDQHRDKTNIIRRSRLHSEYHT